MSNLSEKELVAKGKIKGKLEELMPKGTVVDDALLEKVAGGLSEEAFLSQMAGLGLIVADAKPYPGGLGSGKTK
ncbi:MAG: hypothetical protein IJI10_05235 [Eubacterium sp.]|nr:hypothetical protein [Eubacterium sp.]